MPEVKDQIAVVREKVLAEYEAAKNEFDDGDIERVRTDDGYVRRFVRADDEKGAADAVDDLLRALKWRKSIDLARLTDADFPEEYYRLGALFAYGHDRSGATLIILRVKCNKRIEAWYGLLKKYFAYLCERLDRRPGDDNRITVIFDTNGAGVTNVDIDLLRYIVDTLHYFPGATEAVLIYELPFLLGWVLKLAKTWLAKDKQERLHVVSKKDIGQFVDVDQLPDFMNGANAESYRVVPKGVLGAAELAPKYDIKPADAHALVAHCAPWISGDKK